MINHPNRKRRAKTSSSSKVSSPKVPAKTLRANHDHDYSALLSSARASFVAAVRSQDHLFLTDAEGLNEIYLKALPGERQVHTCSCCRRFIESYGRLVAIGDDGETVPVMWNPEGVPEFYHAAFAALSTRVKRARVTSLFLTKQAIWGTPETGEWSHLSVAPPAQLIYRERALTAGQAMAAARENLRTVATALSELKPAWLDEALRLLTNGHLARSEKFVGPAKWLRGLHDRPKGRLGENLLWRAIAAAPEGYCHPKASVLGPLLDDIAAGLPFTEIKARFDAKLGPLVYQRPQAAPSAGSIRMAEELVEKLGIARSLERRMARLEEIETVWTPPVPMAKPARGGIFGHLKAKGEEEMRVAMPPVTVTWEKFTRTGLAIGAEKLELYVPPKGRFIGLTTVVHPDAPPILKWDRDEARNPVAWYCYPNGSEAAQWGLAAGSWVTVSAIALFPNLWGSNPLPFLSEGVVLILDGAADSRTGTGNAIFPECLRDELHGARSVIEAYSKAASLADRDKATACCCGCLPQAHGPPTVSTGGIKKWHGRSSVGRASALVPKVAGSSPAVLTTSKEKS